MFIICTPLPISVWLSQAVGFGRRRLDVDARVEAGGPERWGEEEEGELSSVPLTFRLVRRSWRAGSGCASSRPIGFLRLQTQRWQTPGVALMPQSPLPGAPW